MSIVRPILRPVVRGVVNPVTSKYGGISWQRYWNQRYPSLLTLTVNSNVQVTLGWTNNGAQDYDSISIESSTDGVSYAELTTAVAGAMSKVIGSLTGNFYYFRIRNYAFISHL